MSNRVRWVHENPSGPPSLSPSVHGCVFFFLYTPPQMPHLKNRNRYVILTRIHPHRVGLALISHHAKFETLHTWSMTTFSPTATEQQQLAPAHFTTTSDN
mmetsp:Transcript_9728/g.17138  ORF Transcript_9728/g.17138 Transcript_9728/m.17138 type:complete len:100 (-) Transcript_9728:23-322(-)